MPCYATAKTWQDVPNRSSLKNNALKATFQAGMLYSLKDCATGKLLLSIDPEKGRGKTVDIGMVRRFPIGFNTNRDNTNS